MFLLRVFVVIAIFDITEKKLHMTMLKPVIFKKITLQISHFVSVEYLTISTPTNVSAGPQPFSKAAHSWPWVYGSLT